MHSSHARWLGGLVLLVLLAPALPAGDEKRDENDPTYKGKRLSAWLALLSSKDEKERHSAGQALAAVIEQRRLAARPLVEGLLAVLASLGEMDTRVDLLARMGPTAVPHLTAALWDSNRVRSLLAVLALGRLGPA